jgi:hypothetical protein
MTIAPKTLAWLRHSATVNGSTYSQVLLHLLDRVEALEQSNQDKLDRLIALDRDDDEPAPVATDDELCAVAELERFSRHAWRACYNLGRQHGAAPG